jgi:hypothetical protein
MLVKRAATVLVSLGFHVHHVGAAGEGPPEKRAPSRWGSKTRGEPAVKNRLALLAHFYTLTHVHSSATMVHGTLSPCRLAFVGVIWPPVNDWG